jgi:hypothetical protein
VFCGLQNFESVAQVRREYRHVFDEETPHESSVCRWDKQLKETGEAYYTNSVVEDHPLVTIRWKTFETVLSSVQKCA